MPNLTITILICVALLMFHVLRELLKRIARLKGALKGMMTKARKLEQQRDEAVRILMHCSLNGQELAVGKLLYEIKQETE